MAARIWGIHIRWKAIRRGDRLREKSKETSCWIDGYSIVGIRQWTRLRLTRSRLAEATFLIRRAKSINPEINLENELKRNEEQWKKGIEELIFLHSRIDRSFLPRHDRILTFYSLETCYNWFKTKLDFPIIRESNPWSLVKCWSNRLIPFPTIGFSSLLTSWHSYKRDRSKLTTPPKQKSSLIFSSLAWSHEWRRNSDRTTELIDLSIICSIAP